MSVRELQVVGKGVSMKMEDSDVHVDKAMNSLQTEGLAMVGKLDFFFPLYVDALS